MLADAFHVDVGPDTPMHLAEYLSDREALWQQVVARHGLRPLGLMQLLGESHHYADLLLRMGAGTIAHPTLLSTIKLRQAGFTACCDSEDVLRHWVRVLQDRRLIPRSKSEGVRTSVAP
ncbi:MAG TPA: hypothetical protein VET27_26350 [Mycobacterium sp.]|nr:hypothetical protein [Mycobacterium sp.]